MLGTLALAAVLVAGCRLDLAGVVALDRDGSGVAAVTIRLDDALLDELDAVAIDPSAEVTALVGELEAWEFDRTVGDDLSVTYTLQRPFSDPAEVGEVFRQLSAGLSDDDPALLIDLEVGMDDEGGARVRGEVGFRAPSSIGAELDGETLGPPSDELLVLTQELVRPLLAVTLPGPIDTADADRVEGRTVTWAIPIDGTRSVSASSSPPGIHEQPWLWAVVAGLLLVASVAVVLLRRR